MREAGVIPVVLAVALLAGCGASGGAQQGSASKTHGSASVGTSLSTTPSPTESTATAAQYASIVAKDQQSMADSIRSFTRDYCAVDPSAPPRCLAEALALNLEAQTLVLELNGAKDPSSPTFIGAPPSDVAPLVDDTLGAARTLARASKGMKPKMVQVEFAIDDLQREFAAWSPYM
jgi:hypothetical protein